MSALTRKAILVVFEEMLNEMPFRKITVSELVERTGISSNTFYYHYHDIYDCLRDWLESKRELFVEQADPGKDWVSAAKFLLHTMQSHPRIVYHIFDSLMTERFELYIFHTLKMWFRTYVREYSGQMRLDEQMMDVFCDMLYYALLGSLMDFIWGHMKEDVDTRVEQMAQLCELTLGRFLSDEGE